MNPINLRVRNFRVLRNLDWAPDGVCLLVGPNGAGKTTTLRALQFLRSAWLRGMLEAIRFSGGARGLRCRGAPQDASVEFQLSSEGVIWSLGLPIEGDGVHAYYAEQVQHDGQIVLDIPPLVPNWKLGDQERTRGPRPDIDTILNMTQADWIERFRRTVHGIRVYLVWSLSDVVRPEAGGEGDLYLHPSGRNLVHVLRNWRAAPRKFRNQFEWVRKHAVEAFPDVFTDLEFRPDGSAEFFPVDSRDADDSLPLHLAPDGLLVGLLQLAAVAGAQDGSVIAIDEMENQLHPHAIRSILAAMRALAEERDLTIILTTHSPVVMNEFGTHPGKVFVLDRTSEINPTPLDQLKNPEWLSMFTLGDLYERERFGAPAQPKPVIGSEED